MTGYSQSGSVNWLGFFTDDSVTNLPVHLAVGHGLKGTLVFRGNNIVTNGGSLRIGYFDYADGATRPTADGFGNNTGAVNARGYMVGLNYGTNFSGNPFSLYARNNLAAGDLMGTTGSFLSLGGGPGGYAGASAFQEGVDYTLDFTIARKALNSVTVTVTATGGGTNWTHSRTDTTYAYPRFDCIAIRPASAVSTADSFVFTRFLVQVIDVAPDPIPLTAVAAGGNITLTWSNPAFALQAAPEATGSFTNVPSATSPYTTSAGDARRFFRLNWTAP